VTQLLLCPGHLLLWLLEVGLVLLLRAGCPAAAAAVLVVQHRVPLWLPLLPLLLAMAVVGGQ
jgi:hypothetical protein